jgi:hypothetical protein
MTIWNGSEWVPDRRRNDRRNLPGSGSPIAARTTRLDALGVAFLLHGALDHNTVSFAVALVVLFLATRPARMRVAVVGIFSIEVRFVTGSKSRTSLGCASADHAPSTLRSNRKLRRTRQFLDGMGRRHRKVTSGTIGPVRGDTAAVDVAVASDDDKWGLLLTTRRLRRDQSGIGCDSPTS